jgi:hypothetical protein
LWAGGESYVATSADFGLTWTQVGSSEGLGEEILDSRAAMIQYPNDKIAQAGPPMIHPHATLKVVSPENGVGVFATAHHIPGSA